MEMMSRFIFFLFLFNFALSVKAQNEVNWADHIACIVYTHCTPCHNDKGIAPFKLQSFEDAYDHRYGMEAAISIKRMPPWPPATDFGHLAGERTLSPEEITLFKTWVEQGAPEGSAEAMSPPIFSSNHEIEDPDFSVRLPTFEIPDKRELDLYRCFVIPTNEAEDRFITDIEIVPGNRSVVHHVILFQDTTGIPELLDEEDPDLGYTCFGGIGSDGASMVSGWVPGSSATRAPEGMGIFLPKGATLVAQIHYPEGSVGQLDSTLINLKFSPDKNLRRIENLPVLNHSFGIDRELFIPANTRQTFYEKFFPVPFKVTMTGIAPHAHLICESMKAFATTLQGDTIPLIDIPHWDFEWQGFYQFKRPVVIPAFSTLHGVATYNNTTSNHHLPGPVPTDVFLGEATTNEMMLFFMSLSFYEEGDEDMIIDTASHKKHYQDCVVRDFTSPTMQPNPQLEVMIGPNPVHEFLLVRAPQFLVGKTSFRLLDPLGKDVFRTTILDENSKINIPRSVPSGIYYGRIESGKKASPWHKIALIR
jgi:hypothetical protein